MSPVSAKIVDKRQNHKVINDALLSIIKGSISGVCIQNTKFLALTVQNLWSRLEYTKKDV